MAEIANIGGVLDEATGGIIDFTTEELVISTDDVAIIKTDAEIEKEEARKYMMYFVGVVCCLFVVIVAVAVPVTLKLVGKSCLTQHPTMVPIYRLAVWISDEDGMNITVEDAGFVERYVMAVFYYAMDGESWQGVADTGWLGDASVCE